MPGVFDLVRGRLGFDATSGVLSSPGLAQVRSNIEGIRARIGSTATEARARFQAMRISVVSAGGESSANPPSSVPQVVGSGASLPAPPTGTKAYNGSRVFYVQPGVREATPNPGAPTGKGPVERVYGTPGPSTAKHPVVAGVKLDGAGNPVVYSLLQSASRPIEFVPPKMERFTPAPERPANGGHLGISVY